MNLREKISIVIVNHNGADTLRPCIESILQSSVSGCPLFVIDNGSDDESVSMLETSHMPFTLICQDNVGYAEGANIGIRSTHTPFVLIANPDIVFTSSFLKSCYTSWTAILTLGLQEENSYDGTSGMVFQPALLIPAALCAADVTSSTEAVVRRTEDSMTDRNPSLPSVEQPSSCVEKPCRT